MTQVCPQIPDYARFSAKEACQLLGISFNTLKKYVSIGKISPSYYSDGMPYYPGKEIKKLWRER